MIELTVKLLISLSKRHKKKYKALIFLSDNKFSYGHRTASFVTSAMSVTEKRLIYPVLDISIYVPGAF